MTKLNVISDVLKYQNFDVWHKGNLNPEWKAPRYNYYGSSNYGVLVKLPFFLTSGQMVSFNVNLYKAYQSFMINVSFYMYNNAGGTLYSPKATMIHGNASMQVKMGHDADNYVYLWFSGVSNYLGISISDITIGYSGDPDNGWFKTANYSYSFSENADEMTVVDYDKTLYPPVSQNILNDYLPLSGGTLSGNLQFSDGAIFLRRDANIATGIKMYGAPGATSYYGSGQIYHSEPRSGVGADGVLTALAGKYVTSWATRFNMSTNGAGYGWIWESQPDASRTPTVVAEMRSSDGFFYTKGGVRASNNIIVDPNKSFLFRPDNSSYYSGIGADTQGNECVVIWAANSVTRLRWYAGVNLYNGITANSMMGITPDFEISKASGSPVGYIGGSKILTEASGASSVAWGDITGKPSAFPTTWDNVSGKPSSFTPSTHAHNYLNVLDNRDVTMLPNNIGGSGRFQTFFNMTGMPTSGWHSGIWVNGWTTTYASWQLCGYSGDGTPAANSLYFRSGINSTWNAWKRVAFSDEIPTIPTALKCPYAITFTGGVTGTYDGSAAKTVAIPTTLKNPYALSFSGGESGSYDGSAAKTITIPVINKANVVAALNQSGTNTITQYCDFTAGAGNSGSDVRFKQDVNPMTPILDELMDIDIVTYYWVKDGEVTRDTFGIRAQQFKEKGGVFSKMIHDRGDADKTLWVEYDRIGVLALKGLQELNDKLTRKIEEQDKTIREMQDKLDHVLRMLKA